MSHFTVLVIGSNVTEQLAPYHEFECTGRNDQYVQDIDKTAEEHADFLKEKEHKVRLADGKIVDPYDPICYREPTEEELKDHPHMGGSGCDHKISWSSQDWGDGRGYCTKVHQLPDGAVEFEEPYANFLNYLLRYEDNNQKVVHHGETPILDGDKAPHKYGYILLDEKGEVTKVIRRTNPCAKWDWYTVGGRWMGFFKMKSGKKGVLGTPGVFDNTPEGDADIVLKGDIDFDQMRNDAGEKAGKIWDRVMDVFVGGGDDPDVKNHISWEAMRKKHGDENIEAARKEYHDQISILGLKTSKDDEVRHMWEPDEILCKTRAEYVQEARDAAGCTFAVVKDGKWFERGEMGWWGCVSNEKEKDSWYKEFANMIDALPDNTPLTVVDCHI